MYKLSIIDKISILLIILGAINFGVVGLFNLNIFNFALGSIVLVERISYIIIGVSGINSILIIMRCKSKK